MTASRVETHHQTLINRACGKLKLSNEAFFRTAAAHIPDLSKQLRDGSRIRHQLRPRGGKRQTMKMGRKKICLAL